MSIELGLLANIFNELSRMGLLSVSHISDVVNLTGATADYELQVGQIAYISFTNVTQVPLHIATPNNSYYELHVIPSNTGGTSGGTAGVVFLYPNNTTYSNSFYCAEIWQNSNGLGSGYTQFSAFKIGFAISCITAWVTNRTQYKNVRCLTDNYGISTDWPVVATLSTDWRDTSTAWTSLGTIVFPQSTSGEILVFRAR